MAETPVVSPVPRLAFLGLCHRAETITDGHPYFWHSNLLGLSCCRVSFVFPWNFRGQKLALAIYEPRPGESLRLHFRGMSEQQPLELTLTISRMVTVAESGGAFVQEPIPQNAESIGWSFLFKDIDTDFVFYEPGTYRVHLLDAPGEPLVGQITLAAAEAAPYSADEIAAIRSSPLALKLVRIDLGCKSCGDQFSVYAGLERNQLMEQEGRHWNLDLTQDYFNCQCGAARIPLGYLKRGLHGLLRENLNARPGEQPNSSLGLVRLYEQSVLNEYCRLFQSLIDSQPREEDAQLFLESHTIFLSLFLPRKLMFKKPVLSKYFVDFAILNERKELLLIEIEKPTLRLSNKDGGITAELQHALDQVRRWINEFDKHRAAALDCLGLKLDEVAKIRGVVIAGRTPTEDAESAHLRSTNFGDIEFYTYDDLLRSVTKLIQHVANV